MSETIIRPSTILDMPSIREIYAHHVLHGTATFEITAPSTDEISRRRASIVDAGLPYLIAQLDNSVAGYAYAAPYRPRPAYRHTVEDSIYLHPGHLGQGIGSSLLSELIRACEAGPWRQMVAVIGDSANTASIRLHQKAGFVHTGVFHSVGWKFERWLDTVLMQRALGLADRSRPSSAT